MRILLLAQNAPPRRLESVEQLPEEGYLWLDLVRDEAAGWPQEVRRLTGIGVFDDHVTDSFNPRHPSFFDRGADYELLVFQTLGPSAEQSLIDVRAAAFFLFDRLLVSVRAGDSPSFDMVMRRFEIERLRSPKQPAGLLHLILDTVIDRYLAARARFSERAAELQDELLDPDNPFQDWRKLLDHRRAAGRLEAISNGQWEAVTAWRRGTRTNLSSSLQIRYNDLIGHIERLSAYARIQQQETDSAVQLHFSTVANRTNEIMRVLTVLSAIFLPLMLITGIFGMNFEYMPELKVHYAYFVVLGVMVLLAVGLVLWFRRKKWI